MGSLRENRVRLYGAFSSEFRAADAAVCVARFAVQYLLAPPIRISSHATCAIEIADVASVFSIETSGALALAA
jgi:hypothetical protein